MSQEVGLEREAGKLKTQNIDLAALKPNGKAQIVLNENMAKIQTAYSITPQSFTLIGDTFKKHYVSLPGKYRLPFRIDMTFTLDYPAFLLLVGNGHITFASPWQDNRKIEDIIIPTGKPNQDLYSYDNYLPYNEDTYISVTYNHDEMQIIINDEERFYSRKQVYMKAKNKSDVSMANQEGLDIKLAVSKRSTLTIKSITVTESSDNIPVKRGEFKEYTPPTERERPKHTFDSIIANMPENIAEKTLEIDNFLKSLRPMKFKRSVDKNGVKISYVASDFGISYTLYVSGAQTFHSFGWYIVCDGKPDTWHVKADFMDETLSEIAQTDPALAERIFYAISDCINCCGSKCICKRLYTFNEQKRLACHGRVMLHMCDDDINDVQEFFTYLNAFMEKKMANGEPVLEKVLMMQ